MLSRNLPRATRISLLRPLRPPNTIRPFTRNSQLLLVAPHTPGPQIPYLSQPAFAKPPGPSQQLARLLSTENKRYIRDQVVLAGRWTLIGWTFIFLGVIIYVGIAIEMGERENPTPAEWRFSSRNPLRLARAHLTAVERGEAAILDWARIGGHFRWSLQKLEDMDGDGKGLVGVADGEEILIPDVGKAGFDISGKSYEWRTGYFEVVMGCANAAEHLDGMVLDTTRRLVFPREVMIGPSNPDPRPTPPYMDSPPLEENCEAPYEKPEVFYMRVLTGKGFTTEQRMDAAFGYANWLECKGLNDSATEMYRWSVDIAKGGLAIPADAVLDDRAVIKEGSTRDVTPNLLRATTNLAIHYARNGDIASALPILLSTLRARREAPVSSGHSAADESSPNERAETDIGAAVSFLRKVFSTPKFPDPPPSGDYPVVRASDKPTCEEGELMLYIGEILFATAPENKEGVAWTRQAVTIAEANLPPGRIKSASDDVKRCKECLVVGVDNWETMLQRLSSSRVAMQEREGGSAGWMQFDGWFGSQGEKGKTLDEVGGGVLEAELKTVERLKERIAREGVADEMLKVRSGLTPGGLWVGG